MDLPNEVKCAFLRIKRKTLDLFFSFFFQKYRLAQQVCTSGLRHPQHVRECPIQVLATPLLIQLPADASWRQQLKCRDPYYLCWMIQWSCRLLASVQIRPDYCRHWAGRSEEEWSRRSEMGETHSFCVSLLSPTAPRVSASHTYKGNHFRKHNSGASAVAQVIKPPPVMPGSYMGSGLSLG